MDPYLKLIEQIGEGAFSKLYTAYDSRIKKYIALKIDKNPSNNSNLKTEYEIYKKLSHLSCVPKIYNYIPNITNEFEVNKQLNCIEMELLGKNLLSFKKNFRYYNDLLAYEILIRCLQAIQKIHENGYIHRDIKPSNFCLDIDDEKKIIYNYKHNIYFNHDIKVYLIDFGLVKKMVKNEEETQINEKEEKQNGFVGTYTYASLSAHKKEELGKKDDLWSFFFMLLDLMDENLPWRNINFENEDAIIDCKKKCLEEPEKYLFLKSTKNNKEIMTIFEYIKNLKFETEPDYNFIMNQLLILKNKEIQKILYNNEINNQILILQQNLLIKNNNTNNTQQLLLNNNKSSQQDYIIYKLNKTNNRSIPSLNSTNYSSSIYYKTNYINCISGNNNENFYQSVLKPCSKSPNKITQTKNINYSNSHTNLYDYNNMINIHPFNLQQVNTSHNKAQDKINHEEKNKKKEENHQNDKDLIEFLLGKSNDDSPRKEEKKKAINKKDIKHIKKKKLHIHDKRKSIKFNILKKDT